MQIPPIVVIFTLAALAGRAQPVFYNSQAPQVAFAVSEVHGAAASGNPGRDRGIRDLASDSSALRFVIAADAPESAELARSLGVAPLKNGAPQSYAIRRREQRGRVTIAVLGADPYGRDVRRARPRGSDPPRHRQRDSRFRPLAAHCRAGNQVQYPPRPPHANLFG